ncbi:MAG: DUF1080 domain-containing protein [Verrucomicrobia bacterium]|nr:DUF1080 domain-containing protein [Verrucomicrobiota bacterium]
MIAKVRRLNNCVILFVLTFCTLLKAESVSGDLIGDWTLDLSSNEPGWLSVSENEGQPVVCMLVHVGGIRPLNNVEFRNGRLYFLLKTDRDGRGGPVIQTHTVDVGIKQGKLDGVIIRQPTDGATKRVSFTGKKLPSMPPAPNIATVRFGEAISLFNGKDLTGWRLHNPNKIDGWSVRDGCMVNDTPKTDFSSTGVYGNLRTEAVFGDFKLHIEFLIEADRNSGVYLRGMYEAQVVDRDSRMQGLQGVGSVFGRIPPSDNFGRPGGEWQSYDLTLVDRHVTVVLNGVKVIDNQPVPGPTGGAMHTDPTTPGPIYLQGDHTSVQYRNVVLALVVKD